MDTKTDSTVNTQQPATAGAGAQAPAVIPPAATEQPTAARPQRQVLVVESAIPVFDTAKFEHLQRIAVMIANSNLVPEHLNKQRKIAGTNQYEQLTEKEAVSNCFLVVNQAYKWKMDPFGLAQGVFVTKGKVGYEGKVIAAVVNSHPMMEGRLTYKYEGVFANGQRKVIVSGRLKGDAEDRTVEGTVKDWATDNSGWKQATSADQMLSYRGAREWGRRHLPEALLGVYADEEIEAIDRENNQPARPASIAGEVAAPAVGASRTEALAANLLSASQSTQVQPVTAGAGEKKGDTVVDGATGKVIANLKKGETFDSDTGEIKTVEPVKPTPETIRLAIESCEKQDAMQPILEQIMTLPATEERAEIMRVWNARVMALKPGAEPAAEAKAPAAEAAAPAAAIQEGAPPVTIPPATDDPWPAALQKVLEEIKGAESNADKLDEIVDRQNGVNWPAKLKKQIMAAYRAARAG